MPYHRETSSKEATAFFTPYNMSIFFYLKKDSFPQLKMLNQWYMKNNLLFWLVSVQIDWRLIDMNSKFVLYYGLPFQDLG